MENRPDKIIVHHDGVSRQSPSFGIVNEYHKSRDFPRSSLGFFVGYHYWIERDGLLLQARNDAEIGAHTVGENLSSIGIGLAGNFDAEDPTEAQVQVLGALLARLSTRYNIPATRIFPHRKFATKTCYGLRLHDNWAAIVCLRSQIAVLQRALDALMRARMP